MTNSEYFEKNKISFTKAMEIFNRQKNKKGGTKSFDKFLASEHIETKFKVGDLIVLQLTPEMKSKGWTKNVVFKVVNFTHCGLEARVEALTPDTYTEVGDMRVFKNPMLENNFVLY